MAAYIIFDVEVTDPTKVSEYHQLATESMASFKSKIIAYSEKVEILAGDWKPKALVMVEFESMEQARQWYNSPAYTEAKDILQKIASVKVILVEGA